MSESCVLSMWSPQQQGLNLSPQGVTKGHMNKLYVLAVS